MAPRATPIDDAPVIDVDWSKLTDREAALVRVLCRVSYLDSLLMPDATRRAYLEAVASALNDAVPGIAARAT